MLACQVRFDAPHSVLTFPVSQPRTANLLSQESAIYSRAECAMHSAQPAAERRWSNRRTYTHAARGL